MCHENKLYFVYKIVRLEKILYLPSIIFTENFLLEINKNLKLLNNAYLYEISCNINLVFYSFLFWFSKFRLKKIQSINHKMFISK